MRALVLDVPAPTCARTCSCSTAIALQWRRRCYLATTKAIPTTTPCQHSVEVLVEGQSDTRLETNGRLRSSEERQDDTAAVVKLRPSLTGADISRDTSNSQGCSHPGLNAVSSNFNAAVHYLADSDQQLNGLHILHRYVAAPNELLQCEPQPVAHPVELPAVFTADGNEQHDQTYQQEHQKKIVRQIRACSSLQQLSDLLDQYGPDMDFISVTSCCTTAARLFRGQQSQQPTGTINKASQHPQLHDQDPVFSMEAAMSSESVQHTHSSAHAADISSSEVTSHGLREQAHQLLQQQLVPFLMNRLRRDADADGLVLVLYSLAALGYRQDLPLLMDLEQMAIQVVPQLPPRLLSQLIWSLISLGIPPQRQLQVQVLIHSSRNMHQANDQDCAQLIQGFARLQKRPPERWMAPFYSRVLELLEADQLLPQSLCLIMYSLGKLRFQPPKALLLKLMSTSQQILTDLPPAGLVMLTSAIHRLHVKQPNTRWQYSYLQTAHAVLPDCTARELAVLAVPLLRWRCVLPHDFVEQYLQHCERNMSRMTAQGLAVLGYSLSGLRVLPPKHWLLRFFAAAQQQQLGSTPAGCSYLMHTLGAWRCLETAAWRHQASQQEAVPAAVPTASAVSSEDSSQPAEADCSIMSLRVVRRLMAQCVHCFVENEEMVFTAEQLGMFCKGMAMAGVQARQRLSRRLQQVLLKLLSPRYGRKQKQQPTATTLVNILLALAVCSPRAATPRVMLFIWMAFSKLPPNLSPAQAAAIAWSAAELQHAVHRQGTLANDSALQPPKRVAERLAEHVLANVEEVALKDLQVFLWSSAQAGWNVQPKHVQSLVKGLLRKQKVQLLKQQQGQQQQILQPDGSAVSNEQFGATQAAQVNSCHERKPLHPECEQHVAQTRDVSTVAVHQEDKGHSNPSYSAAPPGQSNETKFAENCLTSGTHALAATNSSNSSVDSKQRLFGSANHRLKQHLRATAAVAAWAHVLTPRLRRATLGLCEAFVLQYMCVLDAAGSAAGLVSSRRVCSTEESADTSCAAAVDDDQLVLRKEIALSLAKHVYSLVSGYSSYSSQGATADVGRYKQRRTQHWVQLPELLAAVLFQQQELYWQQMPESEQQALLNCWTEAGGDDATSR